MKFLKLSYQFSATDYLFLIVILISLLQISQYTAIQGYQLREIKI